jgi:DNA-binding beta-propeller fold protein YncE
MDARIPVKTGKLLVASGALASVLTLMLSGAVQANGVGDLYVATSSGVLEVEVATSAVKETIPIVPSPTALAFSPDGTTLYSTGGSAHVTPIDIATLDLQQAIVMPGPVVGLAMPAGQILVGAIPTRRTLGFAVVHGGAVTESAQLPGAGNLIAADRRDARVAVAEAGKSWLEIVDPATNTLRKTTVAGGIVALAIDRDHGGVLVATQNPNSLIRVDLTSLISTWTVGLSAAPVALAPLASAAIVSSGTDLWKVDGKKAAKFATARQAVIALTASDEGAYVHAAEATGIEVFDAKGAMQRTIELSATRTPISMASVPRGSSLFLGQGSSTSASPVPAGQMPGALTTPVPPSTSTVAETALDIANYPPVQDAALVAVAILFVCWVFIKWYDRRAATRG